MLKPTLRNWLLLALLIVMVDQMSKWLIVQHIPYHTHLPVLSWFNLVYVGNTGAAFSFLANKEWSQTFFSALAIVASVFIIGMLRKNPSDTRLSLALSLILGGAIGNVIDRIRLGHVIDFLDVYWRHWHFPAFNVADSAITLGAMLLLWDAFFAAKQQPSASGDGQQG